MRVVIVNKFARITGGADAYCLLLATGMRERGHDIAFLATGSPDNLETVGAFVPPTVTRDNRAALEWRSQAAVARSALWNRNAYAAMRSLVDDFAPDVVSAHKLYPQLSVSPLVAARRAGVPVVQTVHDYEFVSASPIDDTGRWIDRDEVALRFRVLNTSLFAVKRLIHGRTVARWIAVSDFVAQRLRSSGIEARVLPNPAPPRAAGAIPFSDRRGLVYAGRLTPEKGVGHMVKLAGLLPESPITIAGDGSSAHEVVDAARRVSNLNYLGPIDRQATHDLISGAVAVIVPSLWQEPGALVTVEAMASGTPLVVYRSGGIAEYVSSAGAGLVVEPRPESLAEACNVLVEDESAWSRYSAAGLAAASSTHSLDAHCEALERIFEEARG